MSFRLGLGVLCVALPFAGALFVACADSTPPPGFTPVGGGEEGGSTADGEGGSGWMMPNTTTGNQAGPTTTTGPGPTTNTSTTNTSTSTGGLSCNQGDAEPNDTESTAVDLGTIDDCDGSGESTSGILAGVADTDWFKYNGDDTFGCVATPLRDLTSSDPVRLCKFMQCDGAAPDCPGGTDPATSPDGRPGCCGDAGFEMGIECSGTDDDATIYMRVQTTTNDCVTYSINYHY